MRQYIRIWIISMLLGTVFLNACKRNPCKGVSCENAGFCHDGTCICPAGFEGIDCSIYSSKKFIGTYQATEYCTSDTFSYVCDLTQDPDSTTYILFSNFANSSQSLRATARKNQLIISKQSINSLNIEGSGTIDTVTHIIDLTYTVYSSTHQLIDSCGAIMTHQ